MLIEGLIDDLESGWQESVLKSFRITSYYNLSRIFYEVAKENRLGIEFDAEVALKILKFFSDSEEIVSFERLKKETDKGIGSSPVLSLSIFDRLPNNYSSNHYAAKYLQLSLFFALAAPNKSNRDKKSIFNAALHIGQILRNNYKEISSVPDNAVFFKTMDVFVNEMSDVFKISHYYWENLVKRGINSITGISFAHENLSKKKKSRRAYAGKPSPIRPSGPNDDVYFIDFGDGEVDVDDHTPVCIDEIDTKSFTPLALTNRAINARLSGQPNEQRGLILAPVRHTKKEHEALISWFFTQPATSAKVLLELTYLSSMKAHEVLGIHVLTDSDKNIQNCLKDKDCYAVLDLQRGLYWRKNVELENSFKASVNDKKWLNPNSLWLALPIPDAFLADFNAVFAHDDIQRVASFFEISYVDQFNEIVNLELNKISKESSLNRPMTKRSVRYALFGEIADRYGLQVSSLILANTEFGVLSWHYYMSLRSSRITQIYSEVTEEIGLPSTIRSIPENMGFNGCDFSIDKDVFSSRVRINKDRLFKVYSDFNKLKSEIEFKEAYNALVSYTLTAFFISTSHRRLSGSFVELAMWDDSFKRVLIADKIHFSESASRYLPLPNILSDQIKHTISWIRCLAVKLKRINLEMAIKLAASLELNGGQPFLGIWSDDDQLLPSSTSQIAHFLGEDWTLPQNAMRQLSYQYLLSSIEGARILNKQTGHVPSDMHSFQCTSLSINEGDEEQIHRALLENMLHELGFSAIRKSKDVKFSLTKKQKAGRQKRFIKFPTNINRIKQNAIKAIKAKAKKAVEAAYEKALLEDQTLYEILNVMLDDQPLVLEYAMRYVPSLIESFDTDSSLSPDDFRKLLKNKLVLVPSAEKVLPFDIGLSSRYMTVLDSGLTAVIESILSKTFKLDGLDLELLLVLSLLHDGEEAVFRVLSKKEPKIEIEHFCYLNGFLTAQIENETIFIGGKSALLAALWLNRFPHQGLSVSEAQLSKRLNSIIREGRKGSRKDVKSSSPDSYDNPLVKLAYALSSIIGHRAISLQSLSARLKHAPRNNETGVLYGLRMGTVESKPLSQTVLARLIKPKRYFEKSCLEPARIDPTNSSGHLFVSHSDSSDGLKAFCTEFNKFLNSGSANSTKLIGEYWLNLVGGGGSYDDVHSLIKRSMQLPEIMVLVLAWLLWASKRNRGSNRKSLKVGTIKTYFSKVGKILCGLVELRSLQHLDSDELLDIYQQVIDSGNVDSRSQRLPILQSFHSAVQRFFNVAKVDWRDLDIELPKKQYHANLVTPEEFSLAQKLIAEDPYMNAEDKDTCSIILSLCFKLALRRAEARRLTVKDISFDDMLCFVRSNKWGTVKTLSGNRRVPLDLTLDSDELELLKAFVARAATYGSKTPIFFDLLSKKRIRPLDRLFTRVIEALKLATGDPQARLHDCRHSGINFMATALMLSNSNTDAIAKSIKQFLPDGDVEGFNLRFRARLIASSSDDSALLPALAQIVGHSNARTSLGSYIHLTHYWRWLLSEKQHKENAKLDKAIAAFCNLKLTTLRVDKTRHYASAAYLALPKILGANAEGLEQLYLGKERPDLRLSLWQQDLCEERVLLLKDVEQALRYLELISADSQKRNQGLLKLDQLPFLERYDLSEAWVKAVAEAYQTTISDHQIIYRAYNILSLQSSTDLPKEYRSKEAIRYFERSTFVDLLKKLLKLETEGFDQFESLMGIWEKAWDANTHSFKIELDKISEWEQSLLSLGIKATYGDELEVRRYRGMTKRCLVVKSASFLDGTSVFMPQLSHALFLILILNRVNKVGLKVA
ncbi:site-specific integrase [Marinomonas fungiae]|uniref:Phage integrase family n=1 Tax=Marinomonas fungiae TaxID=1137284 RepID=A0A0K6IU88_9GAMM|nr:site-specific integrase [Marinomonas fungiae]CUB06676.1 Phage integrase family [Marinomonas fungiae]